MKKSKLFISQKGFLRPAIVCILCLLIVVGVYIFEGRGKENSFTVYAYGENIEITNTGIEFLTGSIHDNGLMQGSLMQMYIKGKNIKSIRYSCKNQYIDFTDWTERRSNFSKEKQFTVSYGKETSEYSYLVVNWNPGDTIRQLTDTENSSIAQLSQVLRSDIVVMEVTFLNDEKETKAISINIEDNGNVLAKLQNYEISPDDNFIIKPQKSITPRPKINTEEKFENKNVEYSQVEIDNAKEVAKKYYSEKIFGKGIDSIKYSENSPLLSSGVLDEYKGWSIMIFKAHEEAMDPDIFRTINLARENIENEWIVINEGY